MRVLKLDGIEDEEDENMRRKTFGEEHEYVMDDMTLLSNRLDKVQKGPGMKDLIIERMKEDADNVRYNNIEFLSVVIPSFNRFDLLEKVVESIHKYADVPFEIVIHDDNSKDGSKEQLKKLESKTSTIIYSNGLNLGLAESINRAVRISNSEYILMLNADIIVEKPFFRQLVDILKCPFVGFVNLITTYPEAKNRLSSGNTRFTFHRGIGGGCALGFTRTVFNKVNGWNSTSCRSGNADVSFMVRTIKNGYFPADLVMNKSPVRTLDVDNSRSTIGRIRYDCSYPRIFGLVDNSVDNSVDISNINDLVKLDMSNMYEVMSLERAASTNDFMQYSYRVEEGETNIDYWSKFCSELISENNHVNYELSKRYEHDRWIRNGTAGKAGVVYRRNDGKAEFDVGEMLKRLFSNYYIVQNFSELKWIAEKVKDLKPTVILEVGVEKGGTLKVWEQLLEQNKESILIGIDVGFGSMLWNTDESNVNIHLIQGDSHALTTLDKVKEILGKRKIDFVYIDGEHTSLAAMCDFQYYGSLVKYGGIVGFHDIGDVKDFLGTLPQDRLQKFLKNPPFDDYGAQMTIGTAVYYVE